MTGGSERPNGNYKIWEQRNSTTDPLNNCTGILMDYYDFKNRAMEFYKNVRKRRRYNWVWVVVTCYQRPSVLRADKRKFFESVTTF